MLKKLGFAEALAVLMLLAGGILRIYHLFQVDFLHEPFRLGGLFVAFSEAILHNGFALPLTIPYYSEGGIPFGYPPLGFYVEAVLLQFFPAQQVAIANLLPPLVTVLTLLLAYGLLRQVFSADKKYVLAGLFAYAFLSNAFANQIEAGGLAESFGSLALLLYFAGLFHYRNQPNLIRAVLAGLALALCILSSPGSAIATVPLFGLLMLEMLLKRKDKALQAGIIGLIGGLLSAPYWLTVILNHGRGFFILPVLAQYQHPGKESYLLTLFDTLTKFNIAEGAGSFFWNALIFMGLLWLLFQNKPAIPFVFLTLFSIPRENTWMMAFPAALLFAYGVVPMFQLALDGVSRFKKLLVTVAFALAALWLGAQSFGLVDALVADQQWKLPAAQFTAIQNASAQIPAGEKVLVLANDAVLEWAPYLLRREVVNTKFGLEWQPAELERITLLNTNIQNAQTWDDVSQAVVRLNGQTHIYVLSTDKKKLTALSKNSHVSFALKLEMPEVQVGVLEILNK